MILFKPPSAGTAGLLPAGLAPRARAERRSSGLASVAALPADLGSRGDVVSVKKHVGRNKLLPQGLAVYASPENRKMFEEEKVRLHEGPLPAWPGVFPLSGL